MQLRELQAELLTRAKLGGLSFQMGFVFCDSPATLDRLVESLQKQMAVSVPPIPLEVLAPKGAHLTDAAFNAFDTFQNGVLWLALQRASDADLRALLTRMNELRTGVVAKVHGMLVIAMRDNFAGELSAMVSDLWAVRSFAHTVSIIRDSVVENIAFNGSSPPNPESEPTHPHFVAPMIEAAFSVELVSLHAIDRMLQQAEIAARDLEPVASIKLIANAVNVLKQHAPSLITFEIAERALKLSEHLVSTAHSLAATELLINWIHLKPEAKMRIVRKHAEALIAVSAFALALSILQDTPHVIGADSLARTAQGEALLGLRRDAQAVGFFDQVLKLERRSDSAASTRSYAGLAQAFFNMNGYRNAIERLHLGIPALERRIRRRGNAPVRALRMAHMLSLELQIARITEQPMYRVSPRQVLQDAIVQFGHVPALELQIARLSGK